MAYDHSMPNSGTGSKEVCVPLDSVMMGDMAPEVGDTVQIPAKVTRIQGNDVYAEPENQNSSQKATADDAAAERQRLKAAMNGPQQDTENPGY